MFLVVSLNANVILKSGDRQYWISAEEIDCSLQYVKTKNYKGYILDSSFLAIIENTAASAFPVHQ